VLKTHNSEPHKIATHLAKSAVQLLIKRSQAQSTDMTCPVITR
jgi:hypothetical protein